MTFIEILTKMLAMWGNSIPTGFIQNVQIFKILLKGFNQILGTQNPDLQKYLCCIKKHAIQNLGHLGQH